MTKIPTVTNHVCGNAYLIEKGMNWIIVVGILMAMINTSLAANWNGSIRSKVQIDNRITNDATYSTDLWGLFEYEDSTNELNAGVSVLGRATDYEGDSGVKLYQLFMKKGFSEVNSTVKLGRFQRSDNLGFYLLDGIELHTANDEKSIAVDVYGGVPKRIDHVRSVEGESLFGFEMLFHQDLGWDGGAVPLSLDVLDLRSGFQRFEDDNASHRLTMGLNLEGQILFDSFEKYETRLLGTYEIESNSFEDLLAEGQVDVNEDLRWRGSYEYYRPENDRPTFREHFYSFYVLGEQTLIRTSLDLRVRHDLTVTVGGLRTSQSVGESGYGANAGITVSHWPGVILRAEGEYVELEDDTISSVFLGVEHTPTSTLNLQLNSALRREEKQLGGENWVRGIETRCDYMIQNNIHASFTFNYIWNSRLPDEYLGSFELTYYFDNFKPKAAR